MATWQADLHFKVAAPDLPDDFRERFSTVLPMGRSWSKDVELWGDSDSDRIDVLRVSGTVPEIFCRFELREWKPELYRRFIECVRDIGGCLTSADGEPEAWFGTGRSLPTNSIRSRQAELPNKPLEPTSGASSDTLE